MAADKGSRTEKPTPKRSREARNEGRVARSADIGSWLSFGAVLFALPMFGYRAAIAVTGLTTEVINSMTSADPSQALGLLSAAMHTFAVAVLPLVIVAGIAGLIANFAQVGLRLSPGALGFKWNKVSPKSGFKRIFSPGGAWELTKTLLRLVALVGVGYEADKHLISSLLGSATLPIGSTLSTAFRGIMSAMQSVAALAFLLALVDYGFQRHRFNESMKMTKEEVKREYKESETNPEVRRALRRRRRRMSRSQLIAALARADVVVVNPTHFSVGIRYDRTKDRAPRVVTKGEDADALAIRLAAQAQGIAVVESPPIARSLYDACEIGEEVPVELYQAVARLLAFVYKLSPAARALVDVHKMVA